LPEDDAPARQVVGGKLHLDLVAGKDADEMLAHFAGDVAENLARLAALIQSQLEHGVGQRGGDGGFNFNRLRFGHGWVLQWGYANGWKRLGQGEGR